MTQQVKQLSPDPGPTGEPAIDFTAYRLPLLAVPCPVCGTRAGVGCQRSSGHKANPPHVARGAEADRVTTRNRFDVETSTLAVPPFVPDHHARARQVAGSLRAHDAWDERDFVTLQIEGEPSLLGHRDADAHAAELYRAQAFPDWQKTWYFNAWLGHTPQEEDALGSTPGSSARARSAEQLSSPSSGAGRGEPVAVHALIDLGQGLLRLRSPARLFSSAKGAAQSVVSRLPTETVASALQPVSSGHGQVAATPTGKVVRPPSEKPSTRLRSGETSAISSGGAAEPVAEDAAEHTATPSEGSRSTTSPDGPSSPTYDAILRTLSSYVADAIASFIPAGTSPSSSFAVELTADSSHAIEGVWRDDETGECRVSVPEGCADRLLRQLSLSTPRRGAGFGQLLAPA